MNAASNGTENLRCWERWSKKCENVVRECKAMAEKDLWSGWNQVEKRVHTVNQRDWKKPKRGIKKITVGGSPIFREQRSYFAKMLLFFGEKGHSVELEFEAV